MSIKLICFDLNKTLIHENTWLNLNKAMGMTEEEDQTLFDLYSQGKLSYINWQKELEKIYIARGKATKENILQVIYKYSFVPNAEDIVRYLTNKEYVLSLVSGSIDLLVENVATKLDIPYYFANNKFSFDNNNYLKTIDCIGDDSEIKVQQLKELCHKLDIKYDEVVCVGDGDNDFGIFKLTKHGVTFDNSKIKSEAWKTIDDLSNLKSIL